MLKIIVLRRLFIQNCHTVEVCINCSICITAFIILPREPREAGKLIDAAHIYKRNMTRLIFKYLKH